MKVICTPEQLEIPEVDALGHKFRSLGGQNSLVNGLVEYVFNNSGENFFSSTAYMICNMAGLVVEYATLFTVQPASIMDNLVPVDWPDSKSIDADGVETRRVYQDYFPFHYELADGTFLIQVVHGTNGLTDADRKVYESSLGTLLVKSDGVSLIPQSEV